MRIQGPIGSEGIFLKYISHGRHSNSTITSIKKGKIHLLHPTFLGV